MARMRLLPVSEEEPKIRDAYLRLKSLGLLSEARLITLRYRRFGDDMAFEKICELLPVADRGVLDYFDEGDCRALITICLLSDKLEAGEEWI